MIISLNNNINIFKNYNLINVKIKLKLMTFKHLLKTLKDRILIKLC